MATELAFHHVFCNLCGHATQAPDWGYEEGTGIVLVYCGKGDCEGEEAVYADDLTQDQFDHLQALRRD